MPLRGHSEKSYLSKLDSLDHPAVDSQPSRASWPVVSSRAVTGECTRRYTQGDPKQMKTYQASQSTHDRDTSPLELIFGMSMTNSWQFDIARVVDAVEFLHTASSQCSSRSELRWDELDPFGNPLDHRHDSSLLCMNKTRTHPHKHYHSN